jgi:GntR family transcriptional regulator
MRTGRALVANRCRKHSVRGCAAPECHRGHRSGYGSALAARIRPVSSCIDLYEDAGPWPAISKVDHVQAQRIDPHGPVPPYWQIAAIIKRRTVSGQYPPNARIRTESELVEKYEVARSTGRRTVAALRDEGLVYTVPGTWYIRGGTRR